MHSGKFPFGSWEQQARPWEAEQSQPGALLEMPWLSVLLHQLFCLEDWEARGKLTQPNSDNNCRAARPQKKTRKFLTQGRGWDRLTLMSALSCLSLVPQLTYRRGHTSDFSIKMFYVEPSEFERHWQCFGRSLPFLSHSSLPVCKTRQFWGFLSLACG